MSGPSFHRLRVTEVAPLTDEAVTVTFDVPGQLADDFAYRAGQHVTVRAEIDGGDVRRSYSICSNANDGKLRIGVKRLPGGVFSTWATSHLRSGMELEVMPPVGEFVVDPQPRHYGAVTAGSGITPVLSLVSTTLESEPGCRWTVIFGNRSADQVMFLDELEGLKDRYPDRLHLIHVLSREHGVMPLFTGRLDESKLDELLDRVVSPSAPTEWFLCGPFEMVAAARTVLQGRGLLPDLIHDELFFAGPLDLSSLPPEPSPQPGTVELSVILDGRSTTTRMLPETSVLDAALRVRGELPFSCKGGMCASCKARVVEGEVRMEKNWALVDYEVAQGFILTCQSHPTSDRLTVDYDV
ncbi:MAG TPA: 1,2-phenylacetyl-CoA epoxidase subunit PaaE [Acidimicrobiia bacterium]|nr:1,2-phenylacetyl-CoA epoxidase subunit PaaE [Acidimicrobiia bacterium]